MADPTSQPAAAPTSAADSTCFVIMPFGGYFDQYYDKIYIPAIKDASLSPRRVDDLFRSSSIIDDIWKYVQNASVVLADLSTRNPNVFYELGLAHAIQKPVVLVSQSLDDVPFDLRMLRVVIYDRHDPEWADKLRKNVTRFLKEAIANPAAAVPPVFLRVNDSRPAPGSDTVTRIEKDILQLRGDFERYSQTQARLTRERLADGTSTLVRQSDGSVIDFFQPNDSISKRLYDLVMKESSEKQAGKDSPQKIP